MIYANTIVDECRYIALVSLYFKGDQEDLSSDEYKRHEAETKRLLGNVIAHEWQTVTS